MKGNKKKVRDIPCDFNLWLVRRMQEITKGMTDKSQQKCYKTLGFNFNKTAKKMRQLGYRPNIQEYPSVWASMSVGKGKYFK